MPVGRFSFVFSLFRLALSRPGYILATSCALLLSASTAAGQDAYEDDDTSANASYIGVDAFDQTHDFHDDGDTDWVTFAAAGGLGPIEITTLNLGTNADTEIALYDENLTLVDLGAANPNDDCAPGDLSSCISFTPSTTGVYYVKINAPAANNVFGADTEYDIRVDIPDAPCADGCTSTITGVVEDPSQTPLQSATVAVLLDEGSTGKTLSDSLMTDMNGTYIICGVGTNEREQGPATPYLVKVTAAGFPVHIGNIDAYRCENNMLDVPLNKDNLPVVEVDFAQTDFDPQDGSVASPYQTLEQATLAASASGVINLQPGSSSETFSGGAAISKAVDLVNADPGSGPVIIGQSGARSITTRASAQTGFVAPD